eukprot:SAG11_NODE_1113_length_5809_cov_37.515672_4_plen_72_part_00
MGGGWDEVGRDAFHSQFVAIYGVAYESELAYTLLGVNAVSTWVKCLKYLNVFPHLSMLSATLSLAWCDIVA